MATIDLSAYLPQAGTTADATAIAAALALIQSVVNNLDDANIAGIAASKIAGFPNDGTTVLRGDGTWSSASSAVVPTGTILQYAVSAPPSGFLRCDGSAVSRTTYATLFGVVSTTYGTGDGSTTFNLPDLRGRVPVGFAASGGHTDVSTLGNNDGVALGSRRPAHSHLIPGQNGSGSAHTGFNWGLGANNADYTAGASSSAPTDTPAYLVVNFVIKT